MYIGQSDTFSVKCKSAMGKVQEINRRIIDRGSQWGCSFDG